MLSAISAGVLAPIRVPSWHSNIAREPLLKKFFVKCNQAFESSIRNHGSRGIGLVLCSLPFLKFLERGRPIHKAVPEQ
jgi:hypothetical protein